MDIEFKDMQPIMPKTEIDYIKELQKIINYLSTEIDKLKERKQKLGIKLLTSTAKMPTQAHKGDLWDIYADENMLIVDGESKLVSTGIALEIPDGYQVRLYNRSGNPLKYGIVLSNGIGCVDTKYRGELKGQFFCIKGAYEIKKGDKIMQMELVQTTDIEFKQVQELSETDRGANGFGSTGK